MKASSYRWVMLVLAFLSTFTMHLLIFSYSPLILPVISDMNISYAQASFVFSACILMLIVLRIPWGMICDRLGLRMSMGLALTLVGIFGFLRGFATNYEALLVFQALLGIGLAAIMPCLPKLVFTWFPRKETGSATGIYVAGFAIGNMLGLGLTPNLTMIVGWRGVFQFYGGWGLMLAFLWWILSRENPRAGSSQSFKGSLSLSVIRQREVWVLTGLFLCAAGVYDTVVLWSHPMFEFKGVSPVTAGLMASMLPLGNLFAGPVVGKLSDLMKSRKIPILILGFAIGPFLLLVEAGLEFCLWIAAFAVGFCSLGVVTLVLSIPAESPRLAPSIGSVTGIMTSLGNVGSFTLPVMMGYVKDVTGSFLLAILLLVVVAESVPVLGFMLKKSHYQNRETRRR
jgi:cyanate permease